MCVTSDMDESIPPARADRNTRAAKGGQRHSPPAPQPRPPSIVVEDRAEAALPGEQRVAAEPEQVQEERLVRLLLAVALDFDGDGLGRLAGGEGQRVAGTTPPAQSERRLGHPRHEVVGPRAGGACRAVRTPPAA